MMCERTLNMSLSTIVLLCILSFVAADTDSSDVSISNKVTCRDVMREMKRLFEEQETKLMKRFGRIERNQNAMQEHISNIATAVGYSNDTATDMKSLKTEINNLTTSVRSLEQGMASVQFDLREVKSVTLGKL